GVRHAYGDVRRRRAERRGRVDCVVRCEPHSPYAGTNRRVPASTHRGRSGLRRDRAVRYDRPWRGGDLDPIAVAVVRCDYLYLFADPRRISCGARDRQLVGIRNRATVPAFACAAGRLSDAALRGYRVGRTYDGHIDALLAD